MNKEVTIISNNINKNILKNYPDYFVVEGTNYNLEELLTKDKVIFFESFTKLSEIEIKETFRSLREAGVSYINVTNNIEEVLYTPYLIIYDASKILLEGSTLEVLKEEKLIKKLGLKLPFIIELSYLLQNYDLIKEVYTSKESLKGALWN